MTTPQTPPKQNGPVLEFPADLELVYANLARIAHSPADIVIDFAHLLPGEPRAKIRSRVVMTPLKQLLARSICPPTSRSLIISSVPFNNRPNRPKKRRSTCTNLNRSQMEFEKYLTCALLRVTRLSRKPVN
ncbi:MAG: DUF3467 domain-containing protein [Chloroflexi bacterium]|nr:DUF3467 domain-containing protein [Chloroflexota bacterium]